MTDVAPDIRAGRLSPQTYAVRFAEATPPLTPSQALLEAERCLYCHDAPCTTACPTGIDVPSFIRRISDGNLRGAAQTILAANPLGGMCARVCPTEVLCEQVCVRNAQQGVPVQIGRLQRHAVDALMASSRPQLFARAAASGRRVAVVGAGPAGLSCAHTLARLGNEVTVFDARSKPGGLNEYGLATYKTVDNYAQREIAWLLDLGGIRIQSGWSLGANGTLASLQAEFDAVFLALGLGSVPALDVPGATLHGVRDAVDFIAELRQCTDYAQLPIGRRVVVIGGGMTAVDAAVQARLLGAEDVHMVYRRGPESMGASGAEQAWAQNHGVTLHCWLAPLAIEGRDGHVGAVRFARQQWTDGRLVAKAETVTLEADMVLKAIGQRLDESALRGTGLATKQGRIVTDAVGATNVKGVWAGGDCRFGGLDLTVEAVEHGKLSAYAIHQTLNVA